MQKARYDWNRTGLRDMSKMETRRLRLFSVANLGSHTTLLAANLPTSFACPLRSHSAYHSKIKTFQSYLNKQDSNGTKIRQMRFGPVSKLSHNSQISAVSAAKPSRITIETAREAQD